MKISLKTIVYIAAAIFIVFLWDTALNYYANKDRPIVITNIINEVKNNKYIKQKIGEIDIIEDNFEIYSFNNYSIRFSILFEGRKSNLTLNGIAVKPENNPTWTILKSDSIFNTK